MELDTLVCIINAPMTQHSFTFTSTLSYQRKTYNKNPQVTLAFAGPPLSHSLSVSFCSPITVAEIAISRQLPQIGFLNWWQRQRSAHCGAGTGTGTGRERVREGTFSQLVLELQQLLQLPLLSSQLCRENEMHIKFTQPACGV